MSPFNKCTKRSLLPFLEDALSWLTGTATTKDVRSIKNRVNQLIATQHQQETISTHYLHFKCHQICHSGEQTTNQPGNGNSRKDTSGCHHALQLDQFTLYQPELPADCTSHLLHSGKSQGFTILYETSGHACNGLHRHSYNLYTITLCISSRRSPENVNTHWRDITFNHALTSFIRGHTPLLRIPTHSHFDCRWKVSPTTHTGLCITNQDISSLQFNHTTWKLIGTLQHRYQVFRHNLWQNKSSKILEQQFLTYQQASGQFHSINTALQPHANPPSCIAAIYAKNKAGIKKRCSLQIRNMNSATIPILIAPNVWI